MEIAEAKEVTETAVKHGNYKFWQLKYWKTNTKVNLINFEKKKLKNKDFIWYPCFCFESYAQNQKHGNHRNSKKQP